MTTSLRWFSTDAAVCAQTDPDLFHPEKGGGWRDAVRMCEMCPLQLPCREWSLAQPRDLSGVWGGLTQPGRDKERKRREAAERERTAA